MGLKYEPASEPLHKVLSPTQRSSKGFGCLAVICDPLTFSQRHFAHHKSAIVSLAMHPHKVLRNVQRFRGGLVFKAHRLCVSLNSRLENHKEEEDTPARSRSATSHTTSQPSSRSRCSHTRQVLNPKPKTLKSTPSSLSPCTHTRFAAPYSGLRRALK